MEESFVIIKPDAFEKGVCLAILERLFLKFEVTRIRFVRLTESQVREHYDHIKNIAVFEDMVRFMISRDVFIMIFKGDKVIEKIRAEVGKTFNAEPGTIRGDFGAESYRTLIHASDSRESAYEEIKRFFGEMSHLVETWQCGWCEMRGEVLNCSSSQPLMCPSCGKPICPMCGGALSDTCQRKCGYLLGEDCPGSCLRCDWKPCFDNS